MKPLGIVLVLVAVPLGCRTSSVGRAPAPPSAPAPEAAGEPHRHEAPAERTLDGLAKGATLLDDLGSFKRQVTTRSPEAQSFFDQGLRLTYGFNHDEAARSFARAAQLDPTCAMCFWGAAYTLGPNYNVPMLPDRARAAWEAVLRAQSAAQSATPVEQALVAAVAKRYKGPEYVDPAGMDAFNRAYATAMRGVARQFPTDLDVQVLFAEALMNVSPWRLWLPSGKAAPGTDEIVAALEYVLARDPNHPGANHYYIHAVEASRTPGRAEPSADRLGRLMPAAGHLVHMPAHIYQRVGRYEDASEANRRAVVADRKYMEKLPPPGYYPIYLAHNHGFLAFSASMEGRSAEALGASQKAAQNMPRDVVCTMPGMDFFVSEPLLVMVRFGRWDDILEERKPDEKYQLLVALWHHTRGMALASKGRPAEARVDLDTLRAIGGRIPEDLLAGLNSGRLVLTLAAKVLEARIAEADKKDPMALWEQAVKLEDRLAYNEPADWFYPTRHYLGAALLDAGRARQAEAVYRADLERHPKNGWALFGLWKSLEAQRHAGAATAEREYRAAWRRADIQLSRSAF